MSSWRDAILNDFVPNVSKLTLVADPDCLLTEEKLALELRGRGFDLIEFSDRSNSDTPMNPSTARFGTGVSTPIWSWSSACRMRRWNPCLTTCSRRAGSCRSTWGISFPI